MDRVLNHAKRVRRIGLKYWFKAENDDLSPRVVGGCDAVSGFTSDGEILIEGQEGAKVIRTAMKELLEKCTRKGRSATRQCYWVKGGVIFIRCECNYRKCRNNFTEFHLTLMKGQAREVGESENINVDEIEESYIESLDCEGFDEAAFVLSNV